MSINGKQTVWVLGAGFSRSLGGPLMTELFAPVPEADDLAYFPQKPYGDLAHDLSMTRKVFQHGLKQRCWADAEDFLAKVDEAFDERGPSWNVLERVVRQRSHPSRTLDDYLANIQRITRRTLAAQTVRFVLDPKLEDERWLPYREWAKTLEPGRDTIITFNYDTALERISAVERGRLQTPLPASIPGIANITRTVPVYHLHGCVEWVVEGTGITHVDIEEALDGQREIAIGIPGPNKSAFAKTMVLPLWHAADDALADAENLVFVGYAFPKTDTMAHIRLLREIRKDRCTESRRYAHLVLGRDIHSVDHARMVAMMESCHGPRRRSCMHPGTNHPYTFVIRQHPLGAEDFLPHYSDIIARP